MASIIYTALGDSLTAGTIPFLKNNFVKPYSKLLQEYYRQNIQVITFGKPRLQSFELLNMLKNPHVYYALANSNLITITIGGNDLLQANKRYLQTFNKIEFKHALSLFSNNMNETIYQINKIKSYHSSQASYLIQLIGLYNPYPQLKHSNSWIYDYNQLLQSFAKNNIIYVDIYDDFQNRGTSTLLTGIHPNKKGHELIAHKLILSLPNESSKTKI